MPRSPIVLPADRHAKKPDWLNDVTRYHDRGDIDFGSCNVTCFEQGDFYGLDDLFTEQPAVVSGLAKIYADWIARYLAGLDCRLDVLEPDEVRAALRALGRRLTRDRWRRQPPNRDHHCQGSQ